MGKFFYINIKRDLSYHLTIIYKNEGRFNVNVRYTGNKKKCLFWWLVTQKKMELPSNSVKVMVVVVVFCFRLIGIVNSRLIP